MSGISKEIKRRLNSIKNTSKITRAMELVSAAKMRKSVQAVLAARPFAHGAWETLKQVARREKDFQKGLFAKREIKRLCLVVISGNRGLAGSFNSNIAEAVMTYIADLRGRDADSRGRVGAQDVVPLPSNEYSIVTFGAKARDELIGRGVAVSADFSKEDVVARVSDITPLVSYVFGEYLKKTFDQVVLFYTDYESAIRQTVRSRVLLPLEHAEDLHLGAVKGVETFVSDIHTEFLFEPDRDQVLQFLVKRILDVQLFQAVLESQASEHSARMMAMRNATEAANDMISDLTLEYNKERQSAITQELAEIAASRMAIE